MEYLIGCSEYGLSCVEKKAEDRKQKKPRH